MQLSQSNTLQIPQSAKIESDRKRKTSADQAERRPHHHKHKQSSSSKKTKMSSSEKVKASHILIKHQGSRRKSSWKDPDGHLISATTREEAVSQLQALRSEILSGDASFKDLAAQHSHCSSAKRGGDLGPFRFLSSLSLSSNPSDALTLLLRGILLVLLD